MSCRSIFQIQGKQSLPVSLPNTHEQERHLRLYSSGAAACTFRRSKNAGFSFSKDAQIFAAPANLPGPRVTSAETTLACPSTIVTNAGWAEFSERVSGEWDGFGADFTLEGEPVELPESVVPEAYREWEVKVFDWQTQCPTLAHFNHGVPYFMYKAIKLLPTVGCEADAATRHSVQERMLTLSHHPSFAYKYSGCYVSVWPIFNEIKNANEVLELEHCLIDPRDKESRVRVIQVLGLNDSELKLQNIKVFVEQWYGPFRNGDQLGGCAISNYAFATTQPLSGSKVTGSWQGVGAIASFHDFQNMIQQLEDEYVYKSIRDVGDLILLPKNLWCSIKRGENKETDCEVGWLLDHGQAITSKCTFSSAAEVKEIVIAVETATSE
ncbi:hypothetical protein F511_16109 [Dorcoceras hygrometricum]|uniref:Uncharacterized protein n=1 Tax=Dorcoceras hygrometricum TaxID=472368 RepID=A0A2Z7D2W8_9LAMI|nr:hypothetical protein F511_16109 [Dorcoceras hygrometricum]